MSSRREVRESGDALLFEADLQYRPDAERVLSGEPRLGKYVGSGDGRVEGPEVRGSVRCHLPP